MKQTKNCLNCAFFDDTEIICNGSPCSSEITVDGDAGYCVETECWRQATDENGMPITKKIN